jgi:hypothetical protein
MKVKCWGSWGLSKSWGNGSDLINHGQRDYGPASIRGDEEDVEIFYAQRMDIYISHREDGPGQISTGDSSQQRTEYRSIYSLLRARAQA